VKTFPQRILPFTTHVVNPFMRKLAGATYSPIAMIRHVGRHSGKSYQTPLIVRQVPGGFVLALTYGPEVDWYRNIVAAGGGTLVWHGKAYAIGKPEPLTPDAGRAAFPAPLRGILRLIHTDHFVRVRSQRT